MSGCEYVNYVGNSKLRSSAVWPDMPGSKIDEKWSERNDAERSHNRVQVLGRS